jgi:hypothetical protein
LEERNSLELTGTPTLEFLVRSLATMLTALSRFPTYYVYFNVVIALTFKNRASYIEDGRTATLEMLHYIYIYIFNKYKY